MPIYVDLDKIDKEKIHYVDIDTSENPKETQSYISTRPYEIDNIEIIEGELYYKGKERNETTESTRTLEQEDFQEENFVLTYSIGQIILFFVILFAVVFVFVRSLVTSYTSQIEELEKENDANINKANQVWLNAQAKERELQEKDRAITQQYIALQRQKRELENKITVLEKSNTALLERIGKLQRFQNQEKESCTTARLQQLMEFGKAHGEIVKLKENPRILKNQKLLDDYLHSQKSPEEVGRDYELYISYCLRKQGYKVIERGSILGFLDNGIDLIASKNNSVLLIQCKNWASSKWIQIDVIHQLYGSVADYAQSQDISAKDATGVLITSTRASDQARETAQRWNIKIIERFPMGRFPRIKCKCGTYYLPIDTEYNKIEVFEENGDMWAETVAEAEAHGFIR